MFDLGQPDLAWCRIDDHLIFLDVAKDRYFRLSQKCNQDVLDALAGSKEAYWHQPLSLPRPSGWTLPQHSSAAIQAGSFRLREVARSLWIQRRIEARLKAGSFHAVLSDLRRLVNKRTCDGQALSEAGQASLIGFEHARLLRTAADRCLARSIALAICLASSGDRSSVVLGVRLSPFGAHCWTQHGDTVLNDSLEEVLRYHPILVV